jgi:transposase
VLLAVNGKANLAVAKRLGITRATAATWRKRFAARRMDGLSDEPRPGAPRRIGDDKITEVVGNAGDHTGGGDPLQHPRFPRDDLVSAQRR